VADVYHHQILPPVVPFQRSAAKIKPHCAYHAHGKPSHSFLIHNGNGCDYGLNGCSGFVVKGCWRLVVGRGFPTGFEAGLVVGLGFRHGFTVILVVGRGFPTGFEAGLVVGFRHGFERR
jgi:hypothetical protein